LLLLLSNRTPAKVFISYSHKDAEWLERLKTHLDALESEGAVVVFNDKRIRAGSRWREELVQAIADAKVAVLLVSADFLASAFIKENELPPLLHRAEYDGTAILSVILGHSMYEEIPSLAQFQTVNELSKPLSTLDRNEQEEELVKVVQAIRASFDSPPSPPRNKSRRRPYLLPVSAGILGLILVAALVYLWLRSSGGSPREQERSTVTATASPPGPTPPEGGKDRVVLYGSGTVRVYLKSSAPDMIERLKEKEKVHLEILEGPMSAGATTFAHIYDQSPHPVLVMASRRLTIDELSPFKEKKPFVFEVYLGADRLQMLLATGDKHPLATSSPAARRDWEVQNISNLKKAFPGIFNSNKQEDDLTFARLKEKDQWITNEEGGRKREQIEMDGIYKGSDGSGTVDVWKKNLGEVWETRLGKKWPMDFKFWDIRNEGRIMDLHLSNRIHLGSKVLNHDPARMLDNVGIYNGKLNMIDESGPVKRGLYLYGIVNKTEGNEVNNGQGYGLPESVARLLRFVLELLKAKASPRGEKPEFLSEPCREAQIEYFHLKPKDGLEFGWVPRVVHDKNIFRYPDGGLCDERPKDLEDPAVKAAPAEPSPSPL